MCTTSAESNTAILPKSSVALNNTDHLTTSPYKFRRHCLLEESFVNTEAKEKEPAKDDVNAEEKKSITENDAVVVEEKLEATAMKPDSLPHSEK